MLAARERIAPYIRHTPVIRAPERELWLKCENRQETGSFKLRGALNRILGLTEDEASRGVLAASAGNHGQGVAYAARLRRIPATVVVPEEAVAEKVDAIRKLGARVVQIRGGYAAAEAAGLQMAREAGATWVSPYNDAAVIAGQATVGLELADDLALDDGDWQVFVPAGGGGFVSGIGVALKSLAPRARVIAVQPRACPYLYTHFHGGSMADVVETPTIADGLSGAVESGSITLELLSEVVDEVELVREDEIEAALRWAAQTVREIIEPAAAVALAAALRGDRAAGRRLAVLSGGNVSAALMARVLRGEGNGLHS